MTRARAFTQAVATGQIRLTRAQADRYVGAEVVRWLIATGQVVESPWNGVIESVKETGEYL